MSDIEDVLRSLSHLGTSPPAAPEIVAADVARAHRAATRRRRRRFSTTLVGAVVVGAAAALGPHLIAASTDSGRVTIPSGPKLVAYTGEQPTGFKVSTVPDGWQLVVADRSAFVLGPPGASASTGGANATDGPQPAGNATSLSLRDRIAVSLQLRRTIPDSSQTRPVDINGRSGMLGHPLAAPNRLSDTRWLSFPSGHEGYVLVQVPASLGISDDQIITFAEGITVTEEALFTGG
jgi:hypothetical protein